MNTISYRVMTMPKRLANARKIAKQTDATIVMDERDNIGPWPVAIKTWSMPTNCTHVCVIQDDAVLIDNFTEHAQKCVDVFPDRTIAFFTGNQVINPKLKEFNLGKTWIKMKGVGDACCLLMPTYRIAQWFDFVEKHFILDRHVVKSCPTKICGDDAKLSVFTQMTQDYTVATVRPLVFHPLGHSTLESVYNPRTNELFKQNIDEVDWTIPPSDEKYQCWPFVDPVRVLKGHVIPSLEKHGLGFKYNVNVKP